MIVFVGNKTKLGGLIEVAKNRLSEEVVCIDEHYNIRQQENDILLSSVGASFIVYDTECYLNDADEIVSVIKRIYRANGAKPVLLVPTSNPKNEIVKTAVECQIKLFVNTSLSMGDQKDQFEKIIAGFYEGNADELVVAAESAVSEDNLEIKRFVGELYDAKQREEERENTIVIRKKGTAEVLILSSASILRTAVSIVVSVLAAIGIVTLIYPDIRGPFIEELLNVISALQKMLHIL